MHGDLSIFAISWLPQRIVKVKQMRQATVLVINTLASYLGVVIQVVSGIVLIRVLLNVLGEESYGLFATLVAGGALVSFIQAGIADGARRHLSIEVGTGDREALASVFSCTVLLMTLAAVGVVFVGLAAANTVVSCCSVEQSRIPACYATYYFSIATLGITVFAVPWQAMLNANQQLVALTSLKTIRPLLAMLAALALYLFSGDRLVIYAAMMTSIVFVCQAGLVVYCVKKNPESIFRVGAIQMFRLKSIMVFGGWIVFENFAVALREKGSIIMLTAFFGPVATASYDVAQKLGNQLMLAGSTISGVVSPALTNAEGRGESELVFNLGNILSCYGSYGIALLAIPFMLETPYILELFVGTSNENMVMFARIIALTRMAGVVSWGDAAVAKSQNRIAVISVGLALPYFIGFPICYLLFRAGETSLALLPLMLLLMTAFGGLWFRPWYIRRINEKPWSSFLKDVLLKLLIALTPATLVAVLVHASMPEGFIRLVLVTLVFFLVAVPTIWKLGLSDLERDKLETVFNKVRSKFSMPAMRWGS